MSNFDRDLDFQIKELRKEISSMEKSLSDSHSEETSTFIAIKKSKLQKLQKLQHKLKDIESQYGSNRARSRSWLKFKVKVYAWLGSVGLAIAFIYMSIEFYYGLAVAEGAMQALLILAAFFVSLFFIRQFGGKS